MQTDLRLLLLIIGLVFGAYVLFKAFKKRRFKLPLHLRNEFEKSILETSYSSHRKNRDKIQLGEKDPLFDDFLYKTPLKKETNQVSVKEDNPQAFDEMLEEPLASDDASVQETKAVLASSKNLIVLSILPKTTQDFPGHMLLAALRANNFHYGKQHIFHYHVDNNPTLPVLYSVASIVEPGIFDRHEMANHSFAGIIMWALLPHDSDSQNIFEQMFTSARQLAASLNGVLCDDKRKPMSTHVIAQYRVKLRERHRQVSSELEESR